MASLPSIVVAIITFRLQMKLMIIGLPDKHRRRRRQRGPLWKFAASMFACLMLCAICKKLESEPKLKSTDWKNNNKQISAGHRFLAASS